LETVGLNATRPLVPIETPATGLRRWITHLRTDNPRSLYSPAVGYRRQAEWDDHGEHYNLGWEGPDLWIDVKVPQGVHRVSLYFMNKDGHKGHNRCRDYIIELRKDAAAKATTKPTQWPTPAQSLKAVMAVMDSEVLARTRVRDFWGGVYTRFLVTGPAYYYFKIERNGSINSICSAVFIDRISGPAGPFDQLALPWMARTRYDPPSSTPGASGASPQLNAAVELWSETERHRSNAAPIPSDIATWRLGYRAAVAADAPSNLLANWRWGLPLWTSDDRELFNETMNRAWKAHVRINSAAKVAHATSRPRREGQ
jgi:hypothetical protein